MLALLYLLVGASGLGFALPVLLGGSAPAPLNAFMGSLGLAFSGLSLLVFLATIAVATASRVFLGGPWLEGTFRHLCGAVVRMATVTGILSLASVGAGLVFLTLGHLPLPSVEDSGSGSVAEVLGKTQLAVTLVLLGFAALAEAMRMVRELHDHVPTFTRWTLSLILPATVSAVLLGWIIPYDVAVHRFLTQWVVDGWGGYTRDQVLAIYAREIPRIEWWIGPTLLTVIFCIAAARAWAGVNVTAEEHHMTVGEKSSPTGSILNGDS
ncbi:MAG: hypothetical protein WAK00_02020 [Microbacterium sp.]|uniref:hypothetical protein n=1 Tax=Microbacterium sp. TaxID=51671 RepID=UPI003BB1D296